MGKYTLLAIAFVMLVGILYLAAGFDLLMYLALNDPSYPTCTEWKGRCSPLGVGTGAGLFSVIVCFAATVIVLERRAVWLALQRA